MAASPDYKVYNPRGKYIAACKFPEDAAMIVAGYGKGATIRLGHRIIVWREGSELQEAGESYDYVAQVCYERTSVSQGYHSRGVR
jgi:hypothetical protein